MKKLKTYLTLFFIHHPKYILEPDIDVVMQRSLKFISDREKKENIKEITKINPSRTDYKNLLRSSGWLGQAKLPRYRMKERIIENLKIAVEEIGKIILLEGELRLLSLILNDPGYSGEATTDQDKSFLKNPQKFDYIGWKEKKLTLEERIAFNKYLLFLNKNKMIEIKNLHSTSNYNYRIKVIEDELEIHHTIGYKTEEKTKKYLGKNQKKLKLEEVTEAIEIELKKTENHINWLEELSTPTEIFSSNTLQKLGIKTRKLIVNTATGQ